MFESNRHLEMQSGSEKSFGIVFSIVFFIIGLYPLVDGQGMRLWSVGIAIIFVIVSYSRPKVLSVPNRLWLRLGMILGAVVSPVVMALVYFLTVVPIGMFMKVLGKDLLRKKLDKNANSYWIKRDQAVGSMKYQF